MSYVVAQVTAGNSDHLHTPNYPQTKNVHESLAAALDYLAERPELVRKGYTVRHARVYMNSVYDRGPVTRSEVEAS